jgi:hypothetical protein
MKIVGKYLLNILKWLDIGVNVIFLFGASNETISERAAKARAAGRTWGCVLCRFLGWINPGHCDNALTSTIGDDAVIPDGE